VQLTSANEWLQQGIELLEHTAHLATGPDTADTHTTAIAPIDLQANIQKELREAGVPAMQERYQKLMAERGQTAKRDKDPSIPKPYC
jgi:hypothetical protein